MNGIVNLSPNQLREAADLQEQILTLKEQLLFVLGESPEAIAPGVAASQKPKTRNMSAAGKARISAAAKARWASFRAAKGFAVADGAVSKPKRHLSPAAKARLAAIARARWKKVKAQGKARL